MTGSILVVSMIALLTILIILRFLLKFVIFGLIVGVSLISISLMAPKNQPETINEESVEIVDEDSADVFDKKLKMKLEF